MAKVITSNMGDGIWNDCFRYFPFQKKKKSKTQKKENMNKEYSKRPSNGGTREERINEK